MSALLLLFPVAVLAAIALAPLFIDRADLAEANGEAEEDAR